MSQVRARCFTHKLNGVDKDYCTNDLGVITRDIHKLNDVNGFYYYPQNNFTLPAWEDDGSGGISNPWDDLETWNE